MITILYAGNDADWSEYSEFIPKALSERKIACEILRECDPALVDYIVYAPSSALQDFTPFTHLKAVLSLWAGVERVEGNATLKVPLCRMVDDGLRAGMREWVTGHVLRHHLGMDTHILHQDGVWRHTPPPLAQHRNVGILGLGELGLACADTLTSIGFNVQGWSRSQKSITDVECHSGPEGLSKVLKNSDILVLLLPQTPETHHVLNSQTLAMLPKGAFILNPGRGPLIDDDALLAALETGHIAHATLDVFVTEPLPASHPYWAHPRVTVTPHIASDTRSNTAAIVIADNIERSETGQELRFQVNRSAGY